MVRSRRSWRWLVPSVLGLLEAREKKVREEVGRLRAALGEAEAALQRLVDARATVAEVLAEPSCVVAEPMGSAVAGSVVTRRRERISQLRVLSTTHLRGSTTKPVVSSEV